MLNKVQLIGRLGGDPEIRTTKTKDRDKMAFFSLATSESRKSQDGHEITDWHRVVCFRQQAEFAEKYLKKGRLVYVEGKLKTRQWEDNGQTRYITEVRAIHITPLDSFKNGGAE